MPAAFLSPDNAESVNIAADAIGTDHEVVHIALLLDRTTVIPVVLQEDRVDAVRVVSPDPVEVGDPRIQLVVDPHLEDAVALARIVQAHARLHALPLATAGCLEERR